jgi:hypothetical protein
MLCGCLPVREQMVRHAAASLPAATLRPHLVPGSSPAHAVLPSRCAPPRGAHTFFLRQGEVARWEGYTVNLIHYEDAASLCLAALSGRGAPAGQPYRGRTFLGCDGSPVTFEVWCGSLGGVVGWAWVCLACRLPVLALLVAANQVEWSALPMTCVLPAKQLTPPHLTPQILAGHDGSYCGHWRI